VLVVAAGRQRANTMPVEAAIAILQKAIAERKGEGW
jgi:hypothetical protein